MATLTLEKMAAGGMYDQVGGGFHRYSTDERWLVPHFEKMLYDNALLAVAYAEAWQVTRRPDFARVLRETLDYLLREMTSPEGAFYSATDADSEGEEGKFFVWSAEEIRALLGPDAERFMRHYDVTAGGNFEGHNILNVPRPDEAEHAALAAARQTLYEVRARRIPPLRDDKILAAWNGLLISAFAFGGRVLGESRYLEAAARAADFLLTRMRSPGGVRDLMRAWKDGAAHRRQGFLEDQAFVAAGLLDLFESTVNARWLAEAVALGEVLETRLRRSRAGRLVHDRRRRRRLIAREKPQYDGAEPSGTSVALLNAQRLHTFTGDERWREVAERGFSSVWGCCRASRWRCPRGCWPWTTSPTSPARSPWCCRRGTVEVRRAAAGGSGRHLRPQPGAGGGGRGLRARRRRCRSSRGRSPRAAGRPPTSASAGAAICPPRMRRRCAGSWSRLGRSRAFDLNSIGVSGWVWARGPGGPRCGPPRTPGVPGHGFEAGARLPACRRSCSS